MRVEILSRDGMIRGPLRGGRVGGEDPTRCGVPELRFTANLLKKETTDIEITPTEIPMRGV
jgi:hypothetical protein